MVSSLHYALTAKQSESELERKANKARTRKYWTQEEIDFIERKARRLAAMLKWE